ncbi:tetratricopeptide repeat protein [Planctomycetes bacterium K23_9]|uniref:Tetratricopeptide repeat protein n=1 Tax=Stieleria marina TaxID=1930275 RepID=A0A517NW96_9BACT|nr:Tetratricopeptide repeat protein [Planctomycetes bacterium K23_9]
MPRSGIMFQLFALLLLCNQSGCSSLETKTSEPLVKPLNGSLSQSLGHEPEGKSPVGKSDERTLCMKAAESVAKEGHAKEAILLYEKAESLDRSSDSLDAVLAPLFAQVGQTDKAVARYQRVIGQGTATPETYNNLAWTLIESGRCTEAAANVDLGLETYPNNERLRASRAVVAYKLDDRDEAMKQFIELYGPAAAHHNLAVLDIEHGKLKQAEKHLSKATQIPNCLPQSLALHETLRTKVAKLNHQQAL